MSADFLSLKRHFEVIYCVKFMTLLWKNDSGGAYLDSPLDIDSHLIVSGLVLATGYLR